MLTRKQRWRRVKGHRTSLLDSIAPPVPSRASSSRGVSSSPSKLRQGSSPKTVQRSPISASLQPDYNSSAPVTASSASRMHPLDALAIGDSLLHLMSSSANSSENDSPSRRCLKPANAIRGPGRVRFNHQVRVVLVPSLKELNSLKRNLWWGEDDYLSFRREYILATRAALEASRKVAAETEGGDDEEDEEEEEEESESESESEAKTAERENATKTAPPRRPLPLHHSENTTAESDENTEPSTQVAMPKHSTITTGAASSSSAGGETLMQRLPRPSTELLGQSPDVVSHEAVPKSLLSETLARYNLGRMSSSPPTASRLPSSIESCKPNINNLTTPSQREIVPRTLHDHLEADGESHVQVTRNEARSLEPAAELDRRCVTFSPARESPMLWKAGAECDDFDDDEVRTQALSSLSARTDFDSDEEDDEFCEAKKNTREKMMRDERSLRRNDRDGNSTVMFLG